MIVASWGTMIMSGRGTITSRATVSPNSMMLSMSSRSSCSMTSSSAASATIPSSSRSDTNGPPLIPLPGRIQLAKPIRPWVITRSGQNRTSQDVGRAVTSAACSLCRTAHVLGIASVNTNSTTTLSTKPRHGTPRAEQAGEQERAERGRRRLQDVDGEQDRVEELLRLLDEARQCPPSPRVFVGERLGLVRG